MLLGLTLNAWYRIIDQEYSWIIPVSVTADIPCVCHIHDSVWLREYITHTKNPFCGPYGLKTFPRYSYINCITLIWHIWKYIKIILNCWQIVKFTNTCITTSNVAMRQFWFNRTENREQRSFKAFSKNIHLILWPLPLQQLGWYMTVMTGTLQWTTVTHIHNWQVFTLQN